jgi:hypothetical protein
MPREAEAAGARSHATPRKAAKGKRSLTLTDAILDFRKVGEDRLTIRGSVDGITQSLNVTDFMIELRITNIVTGETQITTQNPTAVR